MLLGLLKVVLTSHCFDLNWEHYHHIFVMAIGTKFTSSYINLFMSQFEGLHVYICHRHEIQVKEKMMSFICSYSNWGFWWQHWCMCRQPMAFPLCMHSRLPAEKVQQMIVTSLDDVTMNACAIWGGKYIRRAHSGFGAFIWVSGTKRLGLLLSH